MITPEESNETEQTFDEILLLPPGHDLNVVAAQVLQGDDLSLRPGDTADIERALDRIYRVVDERRKFALSFAVGRDTDTYFVLDYPPRNEWGNDPTRDRLLWFAYLEREGKTYEEALNLYLGTFRREPPRFSDSAEGAELVIETMRERRYTNFVIDNRANYSPKAMAAYREGKADAPVSCYFYLHKKIRGMAKGETRAHAITLAGINTLWKGAR